MEISEDIDRRRRFRLLWLTALVALAAVTVAVLLRGVGPIDGLVGDDDDELTDQLDARVVDILERASLTDDGVFGEYSDVGNPLDRSDVVIMCAAETFGFEPADAATADEVEVVYAHQMCAESQTELDWPQVIRVAGPIAVRLTHPIEIHMPEQALTDSPDATYADRVRAIVPAGYQDEALAEGGAADSDVADELHDRYQEANG